jgi:MYXO-CTERM domain-containing protein
LVDDATNRQILLNYEAPTFAPIPEPSTYGLGLGFLGLAIAAIRRRRQAVG